MKFLSGILTVVIIVCVGLGIIIISQDKKIDNLTMKLESKADTTFILIPGPRVEILKPVPVHYINRDSLLALEKEWEKKHPAVIVEKIKTDTLWIEGEQVAIAEIDTILADSSSLWVRYWLPPLSYFEVKWYPFVSEATITISKPQRLSPWGLSATILGGKQEDSYRIGMIGALYFKQIGLAGGFDSEGLWMVGLSKLW